MCLLDEYTRITYIRMDSKINEMKQRFHEKLKNVDVKSNCAILSTEKYEDLVNKVKNVKTNGRKVPANFWGHLMCRRDIGNGESAEVKFKC